jgi:hypothetical protein
LTASSRDIICAFFVFSRNRGIATSFFQPFYTTSILLKSKPEEDVTTTNKQ